MGNSFAFYQMRGLPLRLTQSSCNAATSFETHQTQEQIGGLSASIVFSYWGRQTRSIFTIGILLLASLVPFTGKTQCTQANCQYLTILCLSDVYVSNGYFALDVNASGLVNTLVSGFNIRVRHDNTSNFAVNASLTQASLLASIANQGFNLTIDMFDNVSLQGVNGSFCNGFTVTTLFTVKLFTIYFEGKPGECVEFEFTPSYHGFFIQNQREWSNTYGICGSSVSAACASTEFCSESFNISGNIESLGQNCADGTNHGVPDVTVPITNLTTGGTTCTDLTEANGDYDCDVPGGFTYRITPWKQDNLDCGLSSLDIGEIQDHLLGISCLTESWQLIAADANSNGILNALDLVEIQKVIIGDPNTMKSWKFVPTTEYNLFPDPGASLSCQQPPAYNPYIQINNISQNEDFQDFVGIKTGDVNGTCTDCSEFRSSSPSILMTNKQNPSGAWEFAFTSLVSDLGVFYLELTLPADASDLKVESLLAAEYFQYSLIGRTLKMSYFNLFPDGERVLVNQPLVSIFSESLLHHDNNVVLVSKGDLVSKSRGAIDIQLTWPTPNIEAGHSVTVYPNPSDNGKLYVDVNDFDWSNSEFSLFDELGRVISTQSIVAGLRLEINVHALSTGMYMWRIRSVKGDIETGKVIIQN